MNKPLATKDLIAYLKSNPGSYILADQYTDKAPFSDLPGKLSGSMLCTETEFIFDLREGTVPSMFKKGILIIQNRVKTGDYLDTLTLILNPNKNF